MSIICILFIQSIIIYLKLFPLVPASQIPSITAYENNDISLTFTFEKNPSTPQSFQIKMQARNTVITEITDFLFQAAVPKVQVKIQTNNSIEFLKIYF